MTIIHRGTWVRGIPQKGTWCSALACKGESALLSCPVCGKLGSLSGHLVDGAGRVNPSVVCPRARCQFHDFVILEGWNE